MHRDGILPKLKTFTAKAHLGAKRSGTHHGASGAPAKAAAPVDSGVKPEDHTASEDPPKENIG